MNETETTSLAPSEAHESIEPVPTYSPSIWNDPAQLKTAYSAAKYLASSDLVPEATYRNKPENCLIAVDIANRTGISPLMVMQNLFIVKGKHSWSGSFCADAVNASGRFTPLEFITSADNGGSCYAQAVRIRDGKMLKGASVSMQMAHDEGWIAKNGSKWRTMPELMLQYRAAAFFARVYAPDILLGIQTAEEIHDVSGAEESHTTTVRFEMSAARTDEEQKKEEQH